MTERVQEEMKRFFRPEFLTASTRPYCFTPLTKREIRKIVELELQGVRKQLASRETTPIVTDETKDHIASVGQAGDTVSVHPVDGKLVIEKTEAEAPKPVPVAP